MNTTRLSREIDQNRRRFLRAAATAVVSANFSRVGFGNAQSSTGAATVANVGSRTSFGTLKQITAGLLNVGYAEAGPADARAVILLHGWPYDIYSFVEVAPLLASKGDRVIVPYLRRYPKIKVIAMSASYPGGIIPQGVAADAFYEKSATSVAQLLLIVNALKGESESRLLRISTPIWIPKPVRKYWRYHRPIVLPILFWLNGYEHIRRRGQFECIAETIV